MLRIFYFSLFGTEALSRNYDTCISYGKTCPNGACLEKFSRQILKANRKPKEKINYMSNGKKYFNSGVNLSCAG